jgi:hypothetical protein
MRWTLLALILLSVLGCSRGPNSPAPNLDAGLFKENAKGAEDNLKKMRDASAKFYEKHKAAPQQVDDLTGFGAGPDDLKSDKYYSELSFTFFRLKFDDKGALTEGKFRATPKLDAEAPIVMLDAKSGEFEYKAKDAPENAANEPSKGTGIEIK